MEGFVMEKKGAHSAETRSTREFEGRKKNPRVEEKGGAVIVKKSKPECENEQAIYALLSSAREYAGATVKLDDSSVSTKKGHLFPLTSISNIQDALRHLQEHIHSKNVIHSDLKPTHILENDEHGVFFIDFGLACRQGESEIKGFTHKWTSVDALLFETAHELDDYEALFTSALVSLQDRIPREYAIPSEPVTSSTKLWVSWKLKLMDLVCGLWEEQQTALDAVLAFVISKLLLVWTLPRHVGRKLDNKQQRDLVDVSIGGLSLDLAARGDQVWNTFLSHLDRQGGEDGQEGNFTRLTIALTDPRSDFTQPSENMGEETHAQVITSRSCLRNNSYDLLPGATYWDVPSARNSFGARPAKNLTGTPRAEYDALVVRAINTKWTYSDWKFFGSDFKDAGCSIQLLERIRGRILYLETTRNRKGVWDYLTKFEEFFRAYREYRPIDVLLLVIGVEIDCNKQPLLYPESFVLTVDDFQHPWTCGECDKLIAEAQGKTFFYCPPCKHYICDSCVAAHQQLAHGDLVAVDKVPQNLRLIPNMAFFTLLLAGRVCVTNQLGQVLYPVAVETGRVASSSIKRKLEEANFQLKEDNLQLEKDNFKLEEDNFKLEEANSQLTAQVQRQAELIRRLQRQLSAPKRPRPWRAGPTHVGRQRSRLWLRRPPRLWSA